MSNEPRIKSPPRSRLDPLPRARADAAELLKRIRDRSITAGELTLDWGQGENLIDWSWFEPSTAHLASF